MIFRPRSYCCIMQLRDKYYYYRMQQGIKDICKELWMNRLFYLNCFCLISSLQNAAGRFDSLWQNAAGKKLPAASCSGEISEKILDLTPRCIRQQKDLSPHCKMHWRDLTLCCRMQWGVNFNSKNSKIWNQLWKEF
jgi:hypothetical protein